MRHTVRFKLSTGQRDQRDKSAKNSFAGTISTDFFLQEYICCEKTYVLSRDIISFLQLIPGILQLSHLLLTINCSVNFLVYYLASGRALSKLLPGYSIKSYISNNNESFFLSGQYSEMGKSLETIV